MAGGSQASSTPPPSLPSNAGAKRTGRRSPGRHSHAREAPGGRRDSPDNRLSGARFSEVPRLASSSGGARACRHGDPGAGCQRGAGHSGRAQPHLRTQVCAAGRRLITKVLLPGRRRRPGERIHVAHVLEAAGFVLRCKSVCIS